MLSGCLGASGWGIWTQSRRHFVSGTEARRYSFGTFQSEHKSPVRVAVTCELCFNFLKIISGAPAPSSRHKMPLASDWRPGTMPTELHRYKLESRYSEYTQQKIATFFSAEFRGSLVRKNMGAFRYSLPVLKLQYTLRALKIFSNSLAMNIAEYTLYSHKLASYFTYILMIKMWLNNFLYAYVYVAMYLSIIFIAMFIVWIPKQNSKLWWNDIKMNRKITFNNHFGIILTSFWYHNDLLFCLSIYFKMLEHKWLNK